MRLPGTGALRCQGAYDAPMSTTTFAVGDDFICRHCGARYVVSYTRLPIADSGSAYCDVCRRQMIQWNSSQEPSYKLVKRPDPKLPEVRSRSIAPHAPTRPQ